MALTPTWTEPTAFTVGEALTATGMNERILQNLLLLRNRNFVFDQYLYASDETGYSLSTFADVDSTYLTIPITVSSTNLLSIWYLVTRYNGGSGENAYFNLAATPSGGGSAILATSDSDGLFKMKGGTVGEGHGIFVVGYWDNTLTANTTYDITLQWKVSAAFNQVVIHQFPVIMTAWEV